MLAYFQTAELLLLYKFVSLSGTCNEAIIECEIFLPGAVVFSLIRPLMADPCDRLCRYPARSEAPSEVGAVTNQNYTASSGSCSV